MASETHAHVPLELPAACDSPTRPLAPGGVAAQRPFTASGARQSQVLAVHVHFGEYWDTLVAPRDKLGCYVALRVIKKDAGAPPSRVRFEEEDLELYQLKSTPFATSRVVELRSPPLWNELLLVSLPIEWRSQVDADCWSLAIDVVQKDASQQEDVLLASALLPLVKVELSRGQEHVALALHGPDHAALTPLLYLSVSEVTHLQCERVLEVVIEDVVSSLPDDTSRILCVMTSVPLPPSQSLTELFRVIPTRGVAVSTTPRSNSNVWISPVASFKQCAESGSSVARLRYPSLMLDASTSTSVHLHLFHALSVGTGQIQFNASGSASFDLITVRDDGSKTQLKSDLVPTGTVTVSMKVAISVRLWCASAWTAFIESSGLRRVVTTNRRHRKESELYALGWTGAICRGFNRYPVSSLCDEGGLSGLLAQTLAATNTKVGGGDAEQASKEPSHAQQTEVLLHQHIRLLQQEVMAKQSLIEQLRKESETRYTALQECGAELSTARQELRARNEKIAELKAHITAIAQRERDRTEQLLTSGGGSTGLIHDKQSALRINQLIAKYKELEKEHEATQQDLSDARRRLHAFDTLERKYTELEHAHMSQAAMVQRLQQDKAQCAELQRTIRIQEKVIRKLEKAVTTHRLVTDPDHAAEAKREDLPTTGVPLAALRVQVLEQQLHENAREAASEIARLKMRILELEAQCSESNSYDRDHR